jgi:hypothetical protein
VAVGVFEGHRLLVSALRWGKGWEQREKGLVRE